MSISIKTKQYGTAGYQKADIYKKDGLVGLVPAIIAIHGGGWAAGSRSGGGIGRDATFFAKKGMVVASIDYALTPGLVWPVQASDVALAAAWLATQPGVDPARIFAYGLSSGGHLALWLGVNSLVKKAVSVCGPADLGQMVIPAVQALVPNGDYASASPALHVTPSSALTMLWHGTNDQTVPLSQSVIMRDKLLGAGVAVSYNTYDGDHVFDGLSSTEIAEAQTDVTDFFKAVP